MTAYISRTVPNCFAALRQVRSVRRSLPMRVMSSLFTALVLTHLDCGNASLAGLPTCQLNRPQSVLDVAARLVAFKLATLVFRCMHGLAQAYLVGNA